MDKMDYDKIMSDRKLFNETVYTPLTEAIKILEERQKNPDLIKKIETLLDNNIPEPLKKIDKYAISAKQVATPNFDTRWFLKLAKEFQLKPFFSEYFDDKFTSNNSFKHSLGQLLIYNDINRKGENIREKVKIVDFDKYDGKPIKNVKTIWGESLIDFHKGLFNVYGYNLDEFILYDASDLLKKNGSKAERYYVKDSMLKVETDEPSYCRYTNSLTINYNTATEMASADKLIHSASASKDFFKVQCKDRFGNSMSPVNIYLAYI